MKSRKLMATAQSVSELAMKSIAFACLLLVLAGSVVFAQTNPVPLVNQPLVPDTAVPAGKGFSLTVNGTGFVSGSTVNWNGSPRATTFVSGSQLTAAILDSDIKKAGTAWVTVVNSTPGGGVSNVAFFPVSLPVNWDMSGSDFPADTGPMSVGIGDFNGDGKLDLAVGDAGAGEVSILLGNGDGTFQAPVSYTVGQGSSSQFFQLATGDFNGDGKLDFAVSDYADSYVSVFIGNGDGTFKPGLTYVVGTNPSSVAVADFNGDGKLDIVTSNQDCPNNTCGSTTVSVLLGNGDGTFQTHADYNGGPGPNWVIVGDFNRDGKLDLAVVDGQGSSYTSAVVMLLGNGDGTFQSGGSFKLNLNAASGLTADFNGDGKLDLAIADNAGVVSILLGNGDGTFQTRVDYSTGIDSFPWGEIGIGDFNQDGHLDLAVADSGTKRLSILWGNGDGAFQVGDQTTDSGPRGVASADFNGDGRLDLAVAIPGSNVVSILLQDGTVSLVPSTLDFAARLVGSQSGEKKIVLTNAGIKSLKISSIGVTGDAQDFPEGNNCPSSLPPQGHCAIKVSFKPTLRGPRAAAVTITDNAAGSPQSAPLNGTGLTSGPNATLSPTSLDFGRLYVGQRSAPRDTILANYGTKVTHINNITLTGADPQDFAESNKCPKYLRPLASCTISVTFEPLSVGSLTADVSVYDNAPGSPQQVSLSGSGIFQKLCSCGGPCDIYCTYYKHCHCTEDPFSSFVPKAEATDGFGYLGEIDPSFGTCRKGCNARDRFTELR